MFQRVTIVGRLGHDPDLRYTATGVPVATFSVATSRTITDASGNRTESTIWFRVTAWRNLGETCHRHLKKGSVVLVEGELQEPRPFQGRDGEWRASLDVVARAVRFLPSGQRDTAEDKADDEPLILEVQDDENVPF